MLAASIIATPTNPSNDTSGDFQFGSDDVDATFECNLDGGGFTACSADFTTDALTDGSHTLEVRAIDQAGNTDATPATHTWTIDTTAPETLLVSTPDDPTGDVTGDFEFGSDDAGAGYHRRDVHSDLIERHHDDHGPQQAQREAVQHAGKCLHAPAAGAGDGLRRLARPDEMGLETGERLADQAHGKVAHGEDDKELEGHLRQGRSLLDCERCKSAPVQIGERHASSSPFIDVSRAADLSACACVQP